jgi:hypothetical protein
MVKSKKKNDTRSIFKKEIIKECVELENNIDKFSKICGCNLIEKLHSILSIVRKS